jgi:integrase
MPDGPAYRLRGQRLQTAIAVQQVTGLEVAPRDRAAPSKKPKRRNRSGLLGVADGTRTHDDQNHNLGLYQLSYSHR